MGKDKDKDKSKGKGEPKGRDEPKGKSKGKVGRPAPEPAAAQAADADRSRRGRSAGANGSLGRADYEVLLEPLQLELDRLARWVRHHGRRVLVLFEGRDTAGKGGVIRAIADSMDPRLCRIVALGKPDEVERTQWYFQRYVANLPAAGEIVLFDRSWYNRAGVERVLGFCTEEEVTHFLAQVPVFERLLVDDGILLFKYWLTVDQVRQEERLRERAEDPLKRWKLSPVDLKSRAKYREYGEAREAMFAATHTPHAPWTLVDFDDQRLGRLTLIRHLLDRVPDTEVASPPVELAPLDAPPAKESFGALRPIPPYQGPREG